VSAAERARRAAAEGGRAPNAFVRVLPAEAGEAASAAPIAVKNNIAVRGVPTRAGFDPAYALEPAAADATVVARWREAGGAVIGVTTMDEGALGASGTALGIGPIGNPAAPGFSPGGSSGGSAAAVAAGIVPLALGTDTMGSVRIPASHCGVVGFKPSRGVLPRAGVTPLAPSFDHVGLIAASVADVGRALPILAGPDSADPASRALPPAPADAAGQTLRGRILGVPAFAREAALEPAVRIAFEEACALLARAGARLVPLAWDARFSSGLRKETFLLVEREAAALADLIDDASGRASPGFRRLVAFGRGLPPERVARARAALRAIASRVAEDMAGIDAVITPTTPQRAFPHGAPPPPDQADFTSLANVAGLPALSVPMPCAERPVGLQIMGRDLGDDALLGLGAAIETVLAGA
jgi:aspartyl-tRNA(Asn)/glutamyl-tRNA(Gln) amidotransferase subunit A